MNEERGAVRLIGSVPQMAVDIGHQQLRLVLVVAGERDRRAWRRNLAGDWKRDHRDRFGKIEARPIPSLRRSKNGVEAKPYRVPRYEAMPAILAALIAQQHMQ